MAASAWRMRSETWARSLSVGMSCGRNAPRGSFMRSPHTCLRPFAQRAGPSSTPRQRPAWLDADADQRANARQQFFLVEGLGDIQVGALLQTPLLIEWRILATDQDHWNVAAGLILLQLAADLKAVLLGQDDIEHDALWPLRANHLQRFIAVSGGHHIVATLAQWCGDQCQIGPAIVYDQNLWRGHG